MSVESDIQKALLDACEAMPDVWAMRCNAGTIRHHGRTIVLAPDGTADIIGCMSTRTAYTVANVAGPVRLIIPGSAFFGLEVKDPDGRTSKKRAAKQLEWREMIRALGGFAARVESVDEGLAALDRARRGESE